MASGAMVGVLACAVGCGSRGGVPPGVVTPTSTVNALSQVLSVDLEDVDQLRDGLPLPDGTDRVLGARLRVEGDPRALQRVDGPDGAAALQFPAACDDRPECPRAIVEVLDEADLSPGERDFELVALLKMEPDETSVGANVAQKGFSTGGGGQWKLQVDGEQGVPSCVLVATSSASADGEIVDGERHLVTADESVADGSWHEVSCLRRGNRLLVAVDGGPETATALPPGVDVRPEGPVRIGGKNLRLDNDQFSGAIQRVQLSVESGEDDA